MKVKKKKKTVKMFKHKQQRPIASVKMTSDTQLEIQHRLVRQKGQIDARKSYSIKFVPSFENDAPVEDGKWIKKIFESKSEHEALVSFHQHLSHIVSSGRPRAISLNNARAVVKFGYGKAHSMVSANHPRLVQVKTAAVHVAASNGWCKLLEELLANGAHWSCDSDVLVDGIEALRNVTSLHWACAFNRRNVIQILVERDDADVNVRDGENSTPLMVAARFGYRNVMELLMRNGADVNVINDAGLNALLVAAQSGHRDIVRFLVEYGVKIDDNISEELSRYDHLHRIDAHGNTALHIACSIKLGSLVTSLMVERRKSSAAYLNEYLNVTNSNHQTALHLAVASGSLKIVKELLSMGIKHDVKDSFGNTPLHIACLKGNIELVECLLTDDNLLTSANMDGWTPTHCSVASNKPEVLRMVIGRLEAMHGGKLSLAETPDAAGNSPLHLAVKVNSSEKIITEMCGFNPYVRDRDGNSPIHVAAKDSSEETLAALLQTFYSPLSNAHHDVDHLNQRSESGLLISVRERNVGKVRLLLEHNAGLSPGGPGAATAMHHLVDADVKSQHNVEMVYRMLVEYSLNRWFVDSGTASDQPRITTNSMEVVRRAVLEMMLNTAHDGQNVLQYAAYQGAWHLLQLVLTDDAFVESSGTFNVTYLIPETVPVLEEEFASEEQDRRSVVELIVVNGGDDNGIVEILSREPFRSVITPYVMLINLVQYLMLLIHVLNMLMFTSCTLKGRVKVEDTAYGMFLLWPFFNFFVDFAHLLIRLNSTRRSLSAAARMKSVQRQFLSVMFSSLFALTTVMWCIVYYNSDNNRVYVCILSVVYVTGWIYTLTMLTVFNRIANLIAIIVVIFYENVLPFLVVYAVQLIAFSLAFFVLQTSPTGWTKSAIKLRLYNHTSTSTLGRVGFSSFFLALGIDLFDGLFPSRRQASIVDDEFDDSGYHVFVGVMFVIFEVITAIVMLNALIAMFTGTYYRRYADAKTKLKADFYRTVGSLMWFERHAGSKSCRCLRTVSCVLSNPKMLRSKSGRRAGMPYEMANKWFIEMPRDCSK